MNLRLTKSIVPNLLTLANLYCGFLSIVFASNGDFEKSALAILLGAFFDMFDGIVARLIGAASELGVQLDSLCDAITFGLAPSYMLYKMYFYQFGSFGLFCSALPAIAGVVRLARFNVQLTSLEDKKFFTGLPIPSAALSIVSYLIFFLGNKTSNILDFTYFPFFVSFVISGVMVSRIKYPNLPRPSKSGIKESPVSFIFLIIIIIATIFTNGIVVFPAMVLYIVAFSLVHFYNWIREYIDPEDDEE
ncbi:MAG: CDP-diacylglycerol--serine O-phosphatidyltransferase [Candidatus Kapabacteria bacterium]|nr:CDP-diacylglycerol--serine O-phosphatidyltransferase [Candidatus Kapabacteria bacterium]